MSHPLPSPHGGQGSGLSDPEVATLVADPATSTGAAILALLDDLIDTSVPPAATVLPYVVGNVVSHTPSGDGSTRTNWGVDTDGRFRAGLDLRCYTEVRHEISVQSAAAQTGSVLGVQLSLDGGTNWVELTTAYADLDLAADSAGRKTSAWVTIPEAKRTATGSDVALIRPASLGIHTSPLSLGRLVLHLR